MTSSLSSSITGKRECAVSRTNGMNSSGSSVTSITSICARGIMMSRAVISDTCSTPSIIDSASASSSWRSNAPCSSSTSCSRSSGSRIRNADRRSSRRGLCGLGWGKSSMRMRDELLRTTGFVRTDRDSPAQRESRLQRFHHSSILVVLVIVALQVQHAVHDEMRAVRAQRLLLLARFAPHHRHAEHEVARDTSALACIVVARR